jgi:Holliday junction resolvasome RuvABC DNA-binding subunit
MPGWSEFIGRGSVGEQLFLWGILSQVLNGLDDPYISELQQASREAHSIELLTPTELAAAVVRGYLTHGDAATEAAKSGIGSQRFDRLVDLAGDVPPPEVLLELYRRGVIGQEATAGQGTGLLDALRRSGIKDEWAFAYTTLAVQNPSWNDAMDALLEGQLTREQAEHWYKIAGGNPDAFQWLYDTRGTSPTPDMLGTMANRRIIEWDGVGPDKTTFEQGFLEGPWRNKWEPYMRALMEYLPPPRTVTALLRAGSITREQALTLFEKEGLTPELAAAYVADAEHHATVSAKELTKADIESLYRAHAVTKDEAAKMLTDLGYSASHAAILISGIDLQRTITNTPSAITRVRTLYTHRKLQAAAAVAALRALGVSEPQAQELVATWDIELGATVAQLTESQIVAAWAYEIMDQDKAMTELQAIGYVPYDAWVLLSIRNKGALPNQPPPGPGPIGVV